MNRAGCPWSPSEVRKLMELHEKKVAPEDIAVIIGRPLGGVTAKLRLLGYRNPRPAAPKAPPLGKLWKLTVNDDRFARAMKGQRFEDDPKAAPTQYDNYQPREVANRSLTGGSF